MSKVFFKVVQYTGENLYEIGTLTTIISSSSEDEKLTLVLSDKNGNHYEISLKKNHYILIDINGVPYVTDGKELVINDIINTFKIDE